MAKNSVAAVSNRRESLLRYLALNQNSTLADITAEFGTSEMTIRRDLHALSEEGLINKGVDNRYSLNSDPAFDPQFFFRYSMNHRKKVAIAEAAAALVPSGSFIFLDSGTTVLEFAKQLIHLDNIFIVTNNLYIPIYISQCPGSITVDFLGGPVDWPSMSTSGVPACRKIEGYQADFVFFSADGVDVSHGVTTKEFQLAEIKQAMLKNARKTVLLTDSSKLNTSSIQSISTLRDVDIIVTDSGASETTLKLLRPYVEQILVAPF